MSISLFNELYLSASFYQYPGTGIFFQILWSVSCIYMIKILVVYTFLYLLLPLWENSRRDYRFYFLCLLVVLSGTMLIRMITQFIVWPYISGVELTDFALDPGGCQIFLFYAGSVTNYRCSCGNKIVLCSG
ncbi:MAG: hypothetical protein KL787_00700 [Taibaiella sp.]|nr:hypothetical protein [Taibaiella sp.]